MLDPRIAQFENIGLSDRFRSESSAEQRRTKLGWLRDIMPMAYPEVMANPQARSELTRYVLNFNAPPKHQLEDQLFTPETLNPEGYRYIHESPEFAALPYKEQQQLRDIWFMKMSRSDPAFAELPAEEKTAFYRNLMRSEPAYRSGTFESGLFLPLTEWTTSGDYWEELPEEERESRRQNLAKDLHNTWGNFAKTFGALILGPARALTGPDSGISVALENAQKEDAFLTAVTREDRIGPIDFTQGLVGSLAGITKGPYMPFMKFFAGKTTLTSAGITHVPGLVEKAGAAMGIKAPPLLAQTLGGTLSGTILGVNKNLMEGNDWDATLKTDAAFGATFQLLSRYVGSVMLMRKVAKGLGVNMEHLITEPLQKEPGKALSAHLQEIWKGRPEMQDLFKAVNVMDKHGVSVKNLNTIPGVRLAANILKRDVRIVDGKFQIMSSGKANARVLATFEGPDNVKIHNALNFLDNDTKAWDVWKKSAAGKHIMESLETQPQIQMTRGTTVPSIAREYLHKQFKHYGVDGGLGRLEDVRKKSQLLDDLYQMLRSRSPKKIAESFSARGISFDTNPEKNLQAIMQMKSDVNTLIPTKPYILVNSKTHKVLPQHNLPTFFGEHPDMNQPHVSRHSFVGTAGQIRQVLQSIKKIGAYEKSTLTRLGNTRNIEVHRFSPNEPVEFHVRVPGGSGEFYDSILHFPTATAALNAMTKGKTAGLSNIIKDIFPGKNDWNKAYDAFVKGMRTFNPEAARNDFLPFQFLHLQAAQQGKFLGTAYGKYIIQNPLEASAKVQQFDNLRDVASFLQKADPRMSAPELLGTLSMDSLNASFREAGFRGVVDPLHFNPSDMAMKRTEGGIGILRNLRSKLQPVEYHVRELNRTSAAQFMRDHYGTNPVKLFNNIRDTIRLENSFVAERLSQKNAILKGLNKAQKEWLYPYHEALNNINEAIPELGLQYQLKADVYQQMVQAIGKTQADRVVQASAEVTKFFNPLFQMLGLPPERYIQHYLPHLREKSAQIGSNLGLQPERFTQIPKADHKHFIDFARTVDPGQLHLIKDVDRLMEIYIRMAGKRMIVEPMMKSVTTELQGVLNTMHSVAKAEGLATIPEDNIKVLVKYFSEVTGAVQGVTNPADRIARFAVAETFRNAAKHIGKTSPAIGRALEEKTHGSVDTIGSFVNLATASHIAGRAYPIARNLTQSFITGGAVIGEANWMWGLSEVMSKPQASIQKLIQLGLIDPTKVPIGVGSTSLKTGSLVSKAMTPYAVSDWINRAVVYEGMNHKVEEAVRKFASGAITKQQFIGESGMRLFGKAQMNEMMQMMNRAPDQASGLLALKDRLNDLAVRQTQYLYERWAQPALFRSGIGRLAGVYTTWPNNYYNLVKSTVLSDSMTAAEKAGFVARLAGNTALVAGGAYAVGMNPSSFLPWNSAVMAPGPHYQMLNDFAMTLSGDKRAWNRFSADLTSLIPFAATGTSLARGIEAIADGDMHEAFLLLASAPLNYELYPRRSTFADDIIQQIQEAGNKFLDMRNMTVHDIVNQ